MKKATLLSFFLVVCALSKAQTSNQLPNNPRLIKANEAKQARIAEQNNPKSIKVSEYYGLEEQIISFLIKKEIPSEMPKAKGYATKAKYVESLNAWMKQNSTYILPEKQNQLITE